MFRILSQPNCPWCIKVEKLLTDNNMEFTSWQPPIDVLRPLAELLNIRTVPQVFRDGVRIGGYEDTVVYLKSLQ